MKRSNLHSLKQFLLAAIFAALLPVSLSAQWTSVWNFGTKINSMYFLDSSTGYIGTTDIWKTTDGGFTWSKYPLYNVTRLTSFTFKNKDSGWCSFFGGQCLRTTNGGKTWLNFGTYDSHSSIYYSPAIKTLIREGWNAGITLSSDDGITWSTLPNTHFMNGLAFMSPLLGVMTDRFNCYRRSTDGGITWDSVVGPHEAWQPLANKEQGLYYAASEGEDRLWRSSDLGVTWRSIFQFQNILPVINGKDITGDIVGDSVSLYVQTTGDGILSSLDSGNTWFKICGPSNDFDTRSLYLRNDTLWAGDYSGNLWLKPDGSKKYADLFKIFDAPSDIHIVAPDCNPVDTALTLHLQCADIKIRYMNVSITGSQQFAWQFNADSSVLHVLYTSHGYNISDSGILAISYSVDENNYGLTIPLSGFAKPYFSATIPGTLSFTFANDCSDIDTSIIIRSGKCYPLIIDSIISETPDILATYGITFPDTIAIDTVLIIPLHIKRMNAGTYQAGIYLHAYSGGLDKYFPILETIVFKKTIQPSFILDPPASIFHKVQLCQNVLDTVTFTNTTCKSLYINSVRISSGSATSDFSLVSVPLLPSFLLTGERDTFIVQLTGDKNSFPAAQLLIGYGFDTLKSTTASIAMSGEVSTVMHLALNPPKMNFGTISTCRESLDTIVISNPLCRTLFVKDISLAPPSANFKIVRSPLLPDSLLKGEGDTVIIHFAAPKVGSYQAFLHINAGYDTLIIKDTLAFVIGKSTDGVNISSSTGNVLQFDTLLPCQDTITSLIFTNNGCDSVEIVSVTLPKNNAFVVTNMPLHRKMAAGDTASLSVEEWASSSGTNQDSISVTVRSASGAEEVVVLYLKGFVGSQRHLISFDPVLRIDSLNECSTFDTTIWVKNPGICDTLSIDTAVFSGSLSNSGGITFHPVVLSPGDSAFFTIHIDLHAVSTADGIVELRGAGIDTTLHLFISTRKQAVPLSLSLADSIFISTPCDNAIKQLSFGNHGCDTLVVDSLSLLGSTQFSMQGDKPPYILPPGSFYSVKIVFDPNGIGDSLAHIHFYSARTGFDQILSLRGILSGMRRTATVEFGIEPLSAKTVPPDSVVHTGLWLRDMLDSSIDLQSVQASLAFNDNVLTFVNAIPGKDWKINSTQAKMGKLNIDLQHTSHIAVPLNAELASITYTASIGDSSESPLVMDSLMFNHGDSLFAKCILSPLGISTSTVFIENQCGDSLLRRFMNTGLVIESVIIQPNPSSDEASGISILLSLRERSPVSVTMIDQLGRTCVEQDYGNLGSGKQVLHLPSKTLQSGIYAIRLSTPKQTQIEKLVIEH